MNDRARADAVYDLLLSRAGERWVQPRKERTARLLEFLDDPQRTYRVVHVTGTNGKTSTSRIIESLLRAHGLRTGLFTSPHLERFTERITVDGAPADDAAVADAWDEISPFVDLVDAELEAAGEEALTFFELLTALAFVVFSDAPVDVAVIEVGMGGAWDSTNTADGDVAVFAPIDIDHADRLGDTIAAIATVKAGIIKPGAAVVSAQQPAEALSVLEAAASAAEATLAVEGRDFALASDRLAVGGQLITVRGIAGVYEDEYLPLYGEHQGFNAALAIAAVESLIGGGSQPITGEVLAEGLGQIASPGRLQLLGIAPTVLVDAAHNPHGARALAEALRTSFDFDEWGVVLGVLGDKDAAGIVDALSPIATEVFVTAPDSERADDPDVLADVVEAAGLRASVHRDLGEAADAARAWAASSPRRAVVIAGSVVLAGEAIALAARDGWKGDSMTTASARAPRRKRSLTAQLAAVVLGFEAIVVFLGGLAVYGLGVLPEGVPKWWGIVGGAVVGVAMLLTAGFVHTRAGIVTGWALQLVVALSAFLVPAMLIIALIFGGMWAFATVQGPRLEARGKAVAPEGE